MAVQHLILGVIIAAVIAILYSMRILIGLERRILQIEAGMTRLLKHVEGEEKRELSILGRLTRKKKPAKKKRKPVKKRKPKKRKKRR